ncbi:MAG: hypothetical protein OEW87_15685 [Flavobacteriaceae bacterium]|nr:hypothetical protein [Flavobacteriaceae bacterium]
MIKNTLSSTFCLIMLIAFFNSAYAQKIKWPSASYSADELLKTNEGVFETKIFYRSEPRVIRREIDLNKIGMGTTINIVDFKNSNIIVLIPSMKMKMDQPFGKKQEGAPVSMDEMEIISKQRIGTETINHLKATKYKITAIPSDGNIYTGLIWEYKNNIVVKMDIKSDNGRFLKQNISNLVIGPQADVLFEVPDEYNSNNLNIGDMMKSLPMNIGQ